MAALPTVVAEVGGEVIRLGATVVMANVAALTALLRDRTGLCMWTVSASEEGVVATCSTGATAIYDAEGRHVSGSDADIPARAASLLAWMRRSDARTIEEVLELALDGTSVTLSTS